jgi:hypothetical protein
MDMRVLRLSLGICLLLVAGVQWAVVLERTVAAGWSWYKFHGYGDDGYITVGATSQILFYVLSLAAAGTGILLSRSAGQDARATLMGKIASRALIGAAVFWSALLASPLVVFTH